MFDKENLEPAFPFGFGLSYTNYTYNKLNIIHPVLSGNEAQIAEIEVTNSGSRPGEEVVQLYIGFKKSGIDRPIKLLRGFQKVALEVGETRRVRFEIKSEDLAWYNPDANRWEIEEMDYEVYVGASSALSELSTASFTYGIK